MTGLQDLAPPERARQLGRPEGEVGLTVAAWMNGFNRPFIQASYRALALEAGSRVLEIGFGNGHDVPDLLGRAEDVRYVGLDLSPTMVAEAARFNHAAVAGGKARFHLGSAEAMPFAPASFDRVVAVNVVYFWPDPVPPLAAVRRVLRPGGLSVVGAADPASQPAAVARPEYGFHPRDEATLVAAHRQAGFSKVEVEVVEHVATGPTGPPPDGASTSSPRGRKPRSDDQPGEVEARLAAGSPAVRALKAWWAILKHRKRPRA